MIVAITGASGFIGNALLRRHVEIGDSVRALSRRDHAAQGAQWFRADLADAGENAETLIRFADGADVLYHCAGEHRDAARMEAVHCEGTRRLLAAAGRRVGRWVQLSSVGAYGPRSGGVITEDTRPTPRGPYEITKTRADAMVLEAAAAGEFGTTLLRPSNVFAPDMPNQSLFQLIAAIDGGRFFFIGPPGASANYVSLGGVVEALLLCATRPAARGRIYNLSDWCSMEDFVAAICAALGKVPPRRRLPLAPVRLAARLLQVLPRFPLTVGRVDALSNRCRYLSERIESELGYRHPVSLQQALGEMVSAWQRKAL